MTDLQIKTVPLDSLTPDPDNARTHDAKNLGAILGSLEQFGQVEPLVVRSGSGVVIGGNGRLEAMRALGFKDVSIVEMDLTDTRARALALALNRTGELAGWDFEKLSTLTEELGASGFNLESIGWTEDDLSPIWAAEWSPPESESLEAHQGRAPAGKENEHMHSVRLTQEQREIFNRAAFALRDRTGDHELTDGRCLELICGDYLAGA